LSAKGHFDFGKNGDINMDKMSLETYYFSKYGLDSMKSLTRLILAASLTLTLIPTDAEAKGRRYAPRPSGGGGGVVLSTPNPQTPLEHNNRGVELGSKGLWADAIREHEIALHDDPHNQTFRTNLSGAHLRYGMYLMGTKHDTYNAMKQFRGALYVDPANEPADEQLDNCLRSAKKDPLDIRYRRNLAETADSSGEYEMAIVEYRKCVKMTDSGQDHAGLGRVLIKAGKPVDGYAALRTAVNKDWGTNRQDLGAAHRQLGDLLKEYAFTAKNTGRGTIGMKRLLNAGTEYRRAVTLNPADADAIRSFVEIAKEAVAIKPSFDNYLMLGGAYVLAGDFPHAKMCYEQCYKVDSQRTELPKARVAFHQAVARSPLAPPEMVADSITKVTKFLESEPANPQLWYILGRLKEHQLDTTGAMDAYRRAEKYNALVDPDLKQAITRLGGQIQSPLLLSQGGGMTSGGVNPNNPVPGAGSSGGASPASTPMQPPPPAAPVVNVKNLETYSKIERNMSSDPDTALDLIDKLLAENAQDGKAYFYQGSIYEKKGDLDHAAMSYRMADGLKEGDAASALRRVNTIRIQDNLKRAEEYIQQSNNVKASEELNEAIIKAPTLPILHTKLADVLRKMGDTKGADKELEKARNLEKSDK
jgi:tetratricopeptide (TPR) repeat protein